MASTHIAFTPAVQQQQSRFGSRAAYARVEARGGWQDGVTPDLAGFIATRDSFYLATASAAGQPYIQHRGGPPGFLRVVDARTLAFADYRGNRQYISIGNLSENDRAFIFLMDYASRQRVKLWGRAEVVDTPAAIAQHRAGDPDGAEEAPERVILFHIEAWDANCPRHIPRLVPAADAEATIESLSLQVAALRAELAALRAGQ